MILDIEYLTAARLVRYRDVLDVIGKLLKDTENIAPWKAAVHFIDVIARYMNTHADSRNILARLARSWLFTEIGQRSNRYESDKWKEKSGTNDKSEKDIRFALIIIDLACRFGNQACLQEARSRFQFWCDPEKLLGRRPAIRELSAKKLSPNTRPLAVRYGLKASLMLDEFHCVWQKYENAKDTPMEPTKSELKSALGYFSNEGLIAR